MVAGVKGVAFVDADVMAVTSSTAAELFLVSRKDRQVKRCIKLGKGVKAESVCSIPNTARVLVADGAGKLCSVDTSVEPAEVKCVATYDLRLTSVCAFDAKTAFIAGAVRNQKTKCSVRRVDMTTGVVSEKPMLEAPMIRALYAQHDQGRLLVGAINVASEDDPQESKTAIMAWSKADDFTKMTKLCVIQGFVHSMAAHPHLKDAYIVLARHSGTAFDSPVRIIRLGDHKRSHAGRSLLAKVGITDTLPIAHDGFIKRFTKHTFFALFGTRAGREHAMAVAPDGTLVTGSVDKSSKGVLQFWDLKILDHEDSEPDNSKSTSETIRRLTSTKSS